MHSGGSAAARTPPPAAAGAAKSAGRAATSALTLLRLPPLPPVATPTLLLVLPGPLVLLVALLLLLLVRAAGPPDELSDDGRLVLCGPAGSDMASTAIAGTVTAAMSCGMFVVRTATSCTTATAGLVAGPGQQKQQNMEPHQLQGIREHHQEPAYSRRRCASVSCPALDTVTWAACTV